MGTCHTYPTRRWECGLPFFREEWSVLVPAAHVQSWDYDERILKVTRPSGSFFPGEAVVGIGTTLGGSDTKYIVKTASDQDEEDTFNENTPFETEADSILDFTETNPFGEF